MSNQLLEFDFGNVTPIRKDISDLRTNIGSGNGGGEPPMELLERVIKIESKLPSLATNEALVRETGLLRSDLNKEIGVLRADFQKEAGSIKAEIGSVKAELYKAMDIQTWRIIRACVLLVIVTSFVVGAVVKFGLIN